MASLEGFYPEKIKHLSLLPETKMIVMSDMHRGDGSGADDFAHNSLLYKCALGYYYKEGFTYVELGDAEELWENNAFDQIYITYSSIYERIKQFHDSDPEKTRYIKIWGNHDVAWRTEQYRKNWLSNLFPGIQIYEAVVLNEDILLWHGHQADPTCRGTGGAFSKFFVRNFWPVMQKCGFKDPTRAANNPGRSNEIDRTLNNWVTDNRKGINTIIAGHTHRPVYANLSLTERKCLELGIGTPGIRDKTSEFSYYNTGCCVHPRCITGIEITSTPDGRPKLTLIKWARSVPEGSGKDMEYNLTIKREVLEE